MADIVLATLNAKYPHCAFGLRYLFANLGPLQGRARLVEFDLRQRPLDVVEALLDHEPRIIGLGVYIWNAAETREVVAILKTVRPDVVVILGGPEVSHEVDGQEIVRLADYVVTGEADVAFGQVCAQVLSGTPPATKVLPAPLPDLASLVLPYDGYTDEDIAHRVIYVEASRGCPFTCEFCLSSLDDTVRRFPLPALFGAFQRLLDRGVRQFKFVDRTFNLEIEIGCKILEFFRERYRPGLFLHLEMIPDRLPPALRESVLRFPPGALQFEVGVQTFNPEVAARIRRRQDEVRTIDNLRFLREQTTVHLHADLIAGLPGETLESLAAGFNRLVSLRPHEIQVGILKRLRGTPIGRHDAEWQMVYRADPPYEILRNRLIDFGTMQRLRRFARYWDLVANSGNFIETTPRLWSPAGSPFAGFMRWSDWLHARIGRQHAIALDHLAKLLFEYLTGELRQPTDLVRQTLARDFQRAGRRVPAAFCDGETAKPPAAPGLRRRSALKRQARHSRQSRAGQGIDPTPSVVA